VKDDKIERLERRIVKRRNNNKWGDLRNKIKRENNIGRRKKG
jgi:hypothetical protein